MYKTHPVFEEPEDPNVKIWRYLRYDHLMSTLEKRALFFPSIHKLGEEDPFEGSYPEPHRQFFNKAWEDRGRMLNFPKPILSDMKEHDQKVRRWLMERIIVNCWHMNDYESAAMWKIYAGGKKGIAIQSTFKRLKESFKDNKEDDVHIGKVKYIDYTKNTIPRDNGFYPCVYKRKSF
jgi:hydroxymethylpyrimidine pyrophosphatase-like HAD family hydrolase